MTPLKLILLFYKKWSRISAESYLQPVILHSSSDHCVWHGTRQDVQAAEKSKCQSELIKALPHPDKLVVYTYGGGRDNECHRRVRPRRALAVPRRVRRHGRLETRRRARDANQHRAAGAGDATGGHAGGRRQDEFPEGRVRLLRAAKQQPHPGRAEQDTQHALAAPRAVLEHPARAEHARAARRSGVCPELRPRSRRRRVPAARAGGNAYCFSNYDYLLFLSLFSTHAFRSYISHA